MPGVRTRVAIVIVAVVASALGGTPSARAGTPIAPAAELSTPVQPGGGTDQLVTTVRTTALRERAARGAPRIVLVGTGVQRALFPAALQASIEPAGGTDTTDLHGYGTAAASTILQLVPDAVVVSKRIRNLDAAWDLVDLDSLASTLEDARANASRTDVVVLAFPPQAALDPVAHLVGHGDYRPFGMGMSMVVEALLTARAPVDGTIAGIPESKDLRDKIFARSNLRQRDAVERFAKQAIAWRRVVRAVGALSDAGVAVVAPAGDFTRRKNNAVVALPAQTVYGVAALPSVITVGAAFDASGVTQLSPTSGRGPTLTLDHKPDLLAPSDVLAMLPAGARLGWADDSARALRALEWAKPGIAPTTCPSIQNLYRCVLQGSSMISAAVVAANLGALVASGVPHTASARAPGDDEILRGIAWASASRKRIAAAPWEQGAGVLEGLAGFNPARTPVPLARADLGEVPWDTAASVRVPIWSGGGQVRSARATLDTFFGAGADGAQTARAYDDSARMSTSADGASATATAAGARRTGGIYSGTLTLQGDEATTIPMWLIQDVPFDFHVDYAYNEFQGGKEGERVERATVVLFAGVPTNIGLVGNAFKNLGRTTARTIGSDPAMGVVVRYATTRDTFTEPFWPAREHGRGRIEAAPPGFYRMHALTDHAIEGVQPRGRTESLGIRLATSGPEAATAPGANVLISSRPPCDGGATGPLGCIARDLTGDEVDRNTGLCVARNDVVAYNVYCGEVAYAVPTAVVSRAVHQIEFDKGEWAQCNVDLALDGTSADLGKLVSRARECGGPVAPTTWSFRGNAPDCLGPTEKITFPTGHPADVDARFTGPSLAAPGRNLPVGVLSYDVKLPYLNTYTTATLTLSYVAENAIIATRFSAGASVATDASHGLLVVDDPDITVQPAITEAAARGTVSTEWAVMSGNATTAQLSLLVIPTAWTRPDLDTTKPIARVQLCDVAVRVSTFAKQGWSQPVVENGRPIQYAPMLDRGVMAQTESARARIRSSFSSGAFRDAGSERESLLFATQIPKNSTMRTDVARRVLSPVGGPAYLTDVRRWGTDAKRYEPVVPATTKANDPGYGVTKLLCSENAMSSADAAVCRAWNSARGAGQVLAELAPNMSVNGRFFGVMTADAAALKRAAGNIAWEIADADDAGAFGGRWATARHATVSDFYDEAMAPFSLNALNGLLWVVKDSAGKYSLLVRSDGTGGVAHTITAPLG